MSVVTPLNASRAERHDRVRASAVQRRLWMAQQLAQGAALSVPLIVKLSGALDVHALRASVRSVCARHDALKIRLFEHDGDVYQEVVSERIVELIETQVPPDELPERIQEELDRPFDLAADLLARAHLWKLGTDLHVLCINVHHAVIDGWSLGVLARELMLAYQANAAKQTLPLPRPSRRYMEYTAAMNSADHGTDLQYWVQQLANAPAFLDFPVDFPRPLEPTMRGAQHPVTISPAQFERLRKFCSGNRCTLSSVLLATYALLLHRYTGQRDLLIGVPCAGRVGTELENVVGCFINTVAVRSEDDPTLTFLEWVRRIQSATLSALEHQAAPFDTVVEELNPQRCEGRAPLIQTLFTLQNELMPVVRMHGLTLEPVSWQRSRAQHEMALCLESHDGRIQGYLEYASELFAPQTAQRLCGHYVALLDRCVTAANSKLLNLSSYTSEEYHQWITLWNDTSRTYNGASSVGAAFKSVTERLPDRLAAASGAERISYRDLDRWSDQVAARFAESSPRGAIAAVCLPAGLTLAAVMLGIFKAGLVYMPVDESWPDERMATVLRAVDVHVVVGSESYIDRVRPLSRLQYDAADLMPSSGASSGSVVRDLDGRQPAYLLFTSGSTGAPKAVLVSHASLLNYASAQNELLGLSHEDVLLQQAANTFDVFFEETIPAWLVGAQVIFRQQHGPLLTARDIFEFVRAHDVTCINMVTAHWHALVQGMREAQLRPPTSLRWVIIGGEAVQADKLESWRATNIPLLHLYGQTEACCDSVAYVYRNGVARACVALPVGRPIANTQVYVLDAWMNPVPVGSYGEIFIGGAGLAIGYPGRARETAQKFVPDPFSAEPGQRLCRTGDLGRINVAGELEFAGRADSQAKIRGYRIEPGEIEAAIARHPNVKDVVVTLHGQAGDQHLVAYCVPGDGQPLSSREMRGWLSGLLPKHCVPAFITWIDAIPMNANGKIDRRMLPPPVVERAVVEPRNALEATLHDIWCECLSRESLSVDDEFMEIGGHSLSMARIASRIEQTLGVAVALQDLFGAQTIEQQARLLLSYRGSESSGR